MAHAAKSPHKTVVLLPTYNEKENIARIVPAILRAAPVDIMVLDDGSPDGTGQIADALAQHEPRLTVVHRKQKEGLGAAYIDGFKRALAHGYGTIVQMDADFSHPVDKVPELIALAETYDVVLGSRWVVGGGTKNWPVSRQMISRFGSLYARTLLGVKIRDLTGGFKCFNRRVLAHMDFDAIASAGYNFQIETTFRALQAGFSVVEMPIIFVERAQGVSKMSGRIVVEAFVQVPMLRLRKRAKKMAKAIKKPT